MFQNNMKSFHPLMLRLLTRVAIHALLGKETVLLLDAMWDCLGCSMFLHLVLQESPVAAGVQIGLAASSVS